MAQKDEAAIRAIYLFHHHEADTYFPSTIFTDSPFLINMNKTKSKKFYNKIHLEIKLIIFFLHKIYPNSLDGLLLDVL